MAVRIELADYDPGWPAQFEQQAKRIRGALGKRVLRIEHAGSTSVPGLAAKPVIDIILAVADSADEEAYLPALEAAGYLLRFREPNWNEHRLFKGPDIDINLHVYSLGCPEIERTLLFRNWLRGNADDREFYARTKHDLATREWPCIDNYAKAKSTVIGDILARAGAKT